MFLRTIVLLDVDETSAISNSSYGQHNGGYRYHEPLFAALKHSGLNEIYLFTAYTVLGVAKNLEQESMGAPSRLKLIRHLEAQGIVVSGVMSLLDPIYGRGMGAYYEEQIKPYEAAVLEGQDLQQGPMHVAYAAACEAELSLRDRSGSHDKGHLFDYTQQHLTQADPEHFLAFIVVDDRMACLEAVEAANRAQHPLLCIQAKPQRVRLEYFDQIRPFLRESFALAEAARLKAQCFAAQCRVDSVETGLLALSQATPPDEPYATVHGFKKPYYMPLSRARACLSQDPEGGDIRQKTQGNNPHVVRLGEIFLVL